MHTFIKELFGALAITALGAVLAAMFAFAACSNSQQCTDNTIEIYKDNGYARYGFPYNQEVRGCMP